MFDEAMERLVVLSAVSAVLVRVAIRPKLGTIRCAL